MEKLEWIHKEFAHIEAQDITAYVEAREDQVGPATVDRELDVFRLIVHRATKSWGLAKPVYSAACHQLTGRTGERNITASDSESKPKWSQLLASRLHRHSTL